VGQDVVIKVLEVCGDYVRLGIIAPRDVCVLRAELLRRRESGEARAAEETLRNDTLGHLLTDALREREPNLDDFPPLPPMVDGRIPCPECGARADLADESGRRWECPACRHSWEDTRD
jgi:carbon storage regulator CsrA